MSIDTQNGLGLSEYGMNWWVRKQNKAPHEYRKTWPPKSMYKNFSEIRLYYQSEEDYLNFVWQKFTKGHKICQITHLQDCVRVIIQVYGRKVGRKNKVI